MNSQETDKSVVTVSAAEVAKELPPGKVSEEQFDLLMAGTSIRGPKVILALRDHLVGGLSQKAAWEANDVNKSQFSRRLLVLFVESRRVRKLSKFYRKG
ncbi:adhesin biosynthesis transcription regulatory family protein [Pseudomonas sp. UMAB-40]|uniref:adhesin biosynthesis transcription regulatory family protein n=1 Tax=Pseudomonas sp. UMAB-40 TaxID=1365407 RepID=UPI00214CD0E4|nr:adhesin biosynthesis transcription regulatory family protein [Pseudomonas sp. UMAB-40]